MRAGGDGWRERKWKRQQEEVGAKAGLRPRPARFHNFILSLLLLLFNFILHFVKILTSRSISFSIFSPPHIRGLVHIILPSTPQQQYLYSHNIFLLSLEKQRKRHDGGPNKMFVRRNLLRKKSVWRTILQCKRKMSVRRIIFCIRRKRHFTAASTRSENIFTFFEYTTNSYI